MAADRRLGGVAVLFLLNGIVLGSWLPRLPEIRDELGLSLGGLGVVLGISGLGGVVGSALSPSVVNRLGPRRTAVWPAAATLVLLPALAVGTSAVMFTAVLCLIAITDALADVGMNAFAGRIEAARGRSIFSRLHGLWSVGALTGGLVTTLALAAGVTHLAQLGITAGVGLVAIVAIRGLLPEIEPKPRPPRSRRQIGFVLALAGAAVATLEGIPADWGTILMTDILLATPATAGLAFLSVSLGMLAGRLVGDMVIDRIGGMRSLGLALALVAAGSAVTVTSPWIPLTLAGFGIWGLGVSVTLPLLYREAATHPDFGEGAGLAALTVGSRLGFLVGPPVVGWAAAATTIPAGIGAVTAAGLATAVVVIFFGLGDR